MVMQENEMITVLSSNLNDELNWNGLQYEFNRRGVKNPEKKLFCDCIAECLLNNLKNDYCRGDLGCCESFLSADDFRIRIIHPDFPSNDLDNIIVPLYFVVYMFYVEYDFKWHGLALWSEKTKKYYSDMKMGDTWISFLEVEKILHECEAGV